MKKILIAASSHTTILAFVYCVRSVVRVFERALLFLVTNGISVYTRAAYLVLLPAHAAAQSTSASTTPGLPELPRLLRRGRPHLWWYLQLVSLCFLLILLIT